MIYSAVLNNWINLNNKAFDELKKYFPVVSDIKKFPDHKTLVTVHRGKKKLKILIYKDKFFIGLHNVSIKQVSKNFNKIYELAKNRDDTYNEYNIACKKWDAYLSWMNIEVK